MSELQEAAIQKLRRLKVGALFMEMGTGKTKVALDLMADRRTRIDVFLWVCPCALRGEIERERLKWHPELPLHVVGCESLGASDRIYVETLSLVEGKRVFIVVDESLKIKNIGAKRTRRILEIGGHAQYKLVLNGTPVSNNVMDLWSQMEFLDRRILDADYREYMWRYAETKRIKDAEGNYLRTIVVGHRNDEHLMSKIEPYVFDAKLYLNIPKHYTEHHYYADRGAYEAYKEALLEEYSDLDDLLSFFALIARLQRFYCRYNRECLARVLDDIQSSDPDAQTVVFVKYVESLPAKGAVIHGGMSRLQQDAALQTFNRREHRVLYMTYGVGAYGLNLQTANHVIFAEHTWDYAQRVQAEARIYRLGQQKTCYYHDVICNVPLERRILEALRCKSGFADTLKTAIQTIKDKRALLTESY